MRKIKLITNVSEFGLFIGVAKTRARLAGATLGMLAGTGAAALGAARYISESSTSVLLNLGIITFVMMLLLISAYLMAMLVGDLVFPGPWREQVLLGQEPEAGSEVLVEDHNIEFLVIMLLCVVFNVVCLNLLTDNFLERYHSGGFYAVQLRSDDVEDRLYALEAIAEPVNYKLWERPELKEIVRGALEDPDQGVRARAIWTAGHLADLEAQQTLLEILDGEASPQEKGAAATALGKLEDPASSREALERLARAELGSAATIGALRGLGLLAQRESLQVAIELSNSSDQDVMLHAYWVMRQLADPEARPYIKKKIEAEPAGVERCALYDTLKMVSSAEDIRWARRQFQTIDADADEASACDLELWEDLDDTKYYMLYADTFREKLMKIVANADASNQRDWFQLIANDPEMPFRLRQVATAVLKELDQAKFR